MAPPCASCTHPNVDELNAELLNGASFSGVSRRYGMTRQAVAAHVKHGHLRDAVAALQLENATMTHEALQHAVMRLHARTLSLLTAAEDERDGKVAASMIREARRQLETIGNLVERTPQAVDLSSAPELDEVIARALDARLGTEARRPSEDEQTFDAGSRPRNEHSLALGP